MLKRLSISLLTVSLLFLLVGCTAEQQEEEPAEISMSVSDVPEPEPIVFEKNGYIDPIPESELVQDSRIAVAEIYLTGTPMEGYGATVVAASDIYGVDYRSTLAIARLESSCGAYCFLPHNAWGWGSVSWSDWDTAIYGFSEQFASLYGSALTYNSAEAYCPSNGEYYANYAKEMMYIGRDVVE